MRAAQATATNAPLDAIEAFALARPPTVDAEIVAQSLHVLATREDEMPIAPTRAYLRECRRVRVADDA